MGIVQQQAFKTMILSYLGMIIGYVNKGLIFVYLLNSAQVGLINMLVSVGVLFALLAGLGSNNMLLKFYPYFRTEDQKHRGLLALNFYLSVIGITVFTLIALLFKEQICALYEDKSPIFVHYYNWFIIIGIGSVFYNLGDAYLKSNFKNVLSVFVYEILLRLCTLVLVILFYFKLLNFTELIVAHAFIYFIPGVILLGYIYKLKALYLRPKFISVSRKWKKIMFSFSFFSYFNTIGTQVIITLDALMIASLTGMGETGVYTTIFFLTSAIQVPYKSMLRGSFALVPVHWKNRDMVSMQKLYRQFSSMGLFIALFASCSVLLVSKDVLALLPPEYRDATTLLALLLIGKIVDMYFGLNGVLLVTSRRYRWDLVFTVSLIFITFLLNLLLIPRYGMNGAAIAASIAVIIFNIGRLVAVKLFFQLLPFEWRQLKFSAIMIIGFVGLYILPIKFIHPLVGAGCKLTLFFLLVAFVIMKTETLIEIKSSILNKIKFWPLKK